jgi:tryptophanyl-tRNA synthetase
MTVSFIADWHALNDYADTSRIKENRSKCFDWLAAGLDPEKCVMFIQRTCPRTPSFICCFP